MFVASLMCRTVALTTPPTTNCPVRSPTARVSRPDTLFEMYNWNVCLALTMGLVAGVVEGDAALEEESVYDADPENVGGSAGSWAPLEEKSLPVAGRVVIESLL